MPYQRRNSLAVTARRRASLAAGGTNDDGMMTTPPPAPPTDRKDNDSSSSSDDNDDDNDSVGSSQSTSTVRPTNVAQYGRIPQLLINDLWSSDATVVRWALRELADLCAPAPALTPPTIPPSTAAAPDHQKAKVKPPANNDTKDKGDDTAADAATRDADPNASEDTAVIDDDDGGDNDNNVVQEEGNKTDERIISDRLWVHQLGGSIILIAVLRKWNRYRKITIEGLRAMANLGANTHFRDLCYANGGVDVTIRAMQHYPRDGIVQRNACACLRRFCLDKKRHGLEFCLDHKWGLRLLIRAMKRFPDQKLLQQFVIDTLYDFCCLEQLRYPLVTTGCIPPLRLAIDRYAEGSCHHDQNLWEKSQIILDRVIE